MTRLRCYGQPHPVVSAFIAMCRHCRRRTDPERPGDEWRESMAKVDPKPISINDKAGQWVCKARVE